MAKNQRDPFYRRCNCNCYFEARNTPLQTVTRALRRTPAGSLVTRTLRGLRSSVGLALVGLFLLGCSSKTRDQKQPASKRPPPRLAPAMDHGRAPMDPKRRVSPTPAKSPPGVDTEADSRTSCGLPFGLKMDATEAEVIRQLRAQGMLLKVGGRFNPKPFFGLTFGRGRFHIETHGPRKGRLAKLELIETLLKKKNNALWVYNRFRREAAKAWREQPWVGIPPSRSGPGRELHALTEWRCGPKRQWIAQVEWANDVDHDTKPNPPGMFWESRAFWTHRPPTPPRTKGSRTKWRHAPIPGLTVAKVRQLLPIDKGTYFRLTDHEHYLTLERKGGCYLGSASPLSSWKGKWKQVGTLLHIILDSNMYNEERIQLRKYAFRRCTYPGKGFGPCLVRHDNPNYGVFAYDSKRIPVLNWYP